MSFVNLRGCKSCFASLFLFGTFGETAWALVWTDICCATTTATVLKGLWATQTSFRYNFFTCQVSHNHPLHYSATSFFLHSYADLLLTSLWPRSSVKRDAIQNTSRVPCGIRIQNYKIYTQRSDYTLRFLREWENFTEGFNYISFRCLQNLVTFSDFLVHTKTRISGTGKTI